MFVAKNRDIVLFRTPFSDKYDLVQKFRGICKTSLDYNNPLDFSEAGLICLDKWDFWHIDIPFSLPSDEAAPVFVYNEYIGANHGFYGAVAISLREHDKTVEDIGSLWVDEEGTKWILISVNADMLTFISENIGESISDYAFKKHVSGKLIYKDNGLHTSDICGVEKSWLTVMEPVIRHKSFEIVVYKGGKKYELSHGMECDRAEIHEVYEIVNPVSMSQEIYKNRPEGGYKAPINSAMGKPMMSVNLVYHIENDGTILCDFEYKNLMNVQFLRCMGAMFQEKLDSFGGGVYRYIPKMLPIDTDEGVFDFSCPVDTAPGFFPKNKQITKEYWENPISPPDRIVDYMRSSTEDSGVGFACGYIPVFDGKPEIRARNLKSAVHIVKTRKGYPFFMDKDKIISARGVAYKKYFATQKKSSSVYTVEYNGEKYMYIDFFEKDTVTIPECGNISVCEKSDGVSYSIENKTLIISADKGYMVLKIQKA